MKFFKISLFLLFVNLVLQVHAQISPFVGGSNFPYLHPTPGKISIMAMSPVTTGITPTRELYQNISDCGFNLVTQQGNLDFYKQQFNLIGDLDLKFIISNNLLGREGEDWFTNNLKDSPYVAGWLLIDEPKFEILNEVNSRYQRLLSLDSDKLVLVNLVGMISQPFTGNYKNLQGYYNYIQKLLKPGVWSYDYYPILIKDGKLIIEYDTFYSDFEIFRNMAQKTRRPFWAFCESMEYTTKWYSRPAANEAYLRFEAFSALAYGAQGIVYWTYGMRPSNDTEKYISALVEVKGNKTQAWFAAQKVNREIIKFNDIFYNCTVVNVRHTGAKLYKNTKRLSGSFGPFSMVRTEDSGVLISDIRSKGKNYIVIVSHDVQEPQKITLELSANGKIKDLTSKTLKEYSGIQDISFILDKGGVLIFEY